MRESPTVARIVVAIVLLGIALGVGDDAAADLDGTTMDVTLVQTHPVFGYELFFGHTYGTTSTIWDPQYPTLPIHVTTPAGAGGFDNSLLIDFSDNQYGDFAGETGSITVEGLAEDVAQGSLVLLDEDGASIGSITGAGGSFTGTWAVNDVLSSGTGALLVVAWDSVPIEPLVPQPRMGEPIAGLTPDEQARFEAGLAEYSRAITVEEGLGPIFNQTNCAACHANPVGGAGSQTVIRFGRSIKGVFDPLEEHGGSLLQALAIDEACAEQVSGDANTTSLRVTNGALGYGLIEAIPDTSILALEGAPPGISGRAHEVVALEAPGTPRVGRFGWKAQVATVLSFSADAALNEMGLTNRFLPAENDPNGVLPPDLEDCDTVDDPEDVDDGEGPGFIDRVTDYQRFLAPPPQTPRAGMQGEAIFETIGCTACHHPEFVTADDPALEDALRNRAIRPYGDFLLHDLGLSADFIAQGDATGRELRTPPLWGVRRRDPLWHDGRFGGGTFADRVTAAIAAHGVFGSEAYDAGVVGDEAHPGAWNVLPDPDRLLLVAFLDSLGRAEFDADGDDAIEIDDFIAFAACHGEGPYDPDDPCAVSDIDGDGDVDAEDFDRFLLVYTGPQDDCNDNGVLDLVDILDGTSTDENADGRPDECATCPADVDGDGTVGLADLIAVLSGWGPCPPDPPCPGDVSGDGVVGLDDLLAVLSTWGACP